MLAAYSMNAGRVLPAEEIDYEDCRADRVTCEFCGHRVFKVVRIGPQGKIHYLSHYRAQTEQARDCEARAALRMKDHGYSGKDNESESRGQALQHRVAALRRVLNDQFRGRRLRSEQFRQNSDGPLMKNGHYVPLTGLRFMRYVNTMGFQKVAAREGHLCNQDDMDKSAERFEANYAKIVKLRENPPFNRNKLDRRQARLVHEMISLLMLDESDRALAALHDHAWASLLIEPWDREKSPLETETLVRMNLTDRKRGGEFDHFDEKVPGQDQQYSDVAFQLLTVRMEQILGDIDYQKAVPAAPVPLPKRKPRPKRTHRIKKAKRRAA